MVLNSRCGLLMDPGVAKLRPTELRLFLSLDRLVGTPGFIRRVSSHAIDYLFCRFCGHRFVGATKRIPWGRLGLLTRMTTRCRGWPMVGCSVLLTPRTPRRLRRSNSLERGLVRQLRLHVVHWTRSLIDERRMNSQQLAWRWFPWVWVLNREDPHPWVCGCEADLATLIRWSLRHLVGNGLRVLGGVAGIGL